MSEVNPAINLSVRFFFSKVARNIVSDRLKETFNHFNVYIRKDIIVYTVVLIQNVHCMRAVSDHYFLYQINKYRKCSIMKTNEELYI